MPLYEYQCTACGERTEIIQKVSDAPYTHCPKCGGEMKKLLSAPAIQFKGSGFYKTDYAAPASSGGSGEGAAAKPDGEARPEAKKPETKTE